MMVHFCKKKDFTVIFEKKKEFLCKKCPNTGKYGPEKALYLDTFHAVNF